MSLLIYLFEQQRIVSIIFVIIQNVVNHYLILQIQFDMFDYKVHWKNHLLCAVGISILYLTPVYLVDFFCFSPGLYFSVWLYSVLLFVNPLAAIPYYFIIKRTLKITSTKSSIFVRNHLLIHYIVVLIYMLMCNLLYGFIPVSEVLPKIFSYEVVSIVLVALLLGFAHFLVKLYLDRPQKYIMIPSNYHENNLQFSLFETFTVLSVFYATIVFFRMTWLSHNRESFQLTVVFIYLLLIVCVLAYLFVSLLQLRLKIFKWEVNATEIYISSLLNINQEFRGIKHDFYNVLQTYGGYLELEDYNSLKKYHNSLFKTTKHAGDFLGLIEALKTRIAVYSLIKAKAEVAEKQEITFSINQICDITDVVLTDIDLCRVLSVVIDNAIEAAQISDKKQISLSFEKKDPETIVFAISNTTKEDAPTDHLFDMGYTTKEGHSGIGLSQVVHILNTYEHCKARANYHDNQFTMFLILATHTDA